MTTPTNAEITAPPTLESGWQTTEFWVTVLTSLVAILVGLGVIGPDFAAKHEDVVNAIALLASVLAPGLYALSRSITKHGHQQAVAAVIAAKEATASTAMAYGGPLPMATGEISSGA